MNRHILFAQQLYQMINGHGSGYAVNDRQDVEGLRYDLACDHQVIMLVDYARSWLGHLTGFPR